MLDPNNLPKPTSEFLGNKTFKLVHYEKQDGDIVEFVKIVRYIMNDTLDGPLLIGQETISTKITVFGHYDD